MDFNDTPEEAEFRAEARAWLEANAPKNWQKRMQTEGMQPVCREWQATKYDAGWACLGWPEEYGGRALSSNKSAIFSEEESKLAPPSAAMLVVGVGMTGPMLMVHANDDQKERFLKKTARADIVWCQLFSEPGAGSDFAGLGTKAIKDGDEWIVNGQKVWNTLAHIADFGMLVTRTDPNVPKHRGMTYFALDMKAPGVEVRPLRQITGEAEFNEVYMTDVRVHDDYRIGAEGEGWRAALTTLMNERTAIGGSGGGSGGPRRGGGAIAGLTAIWEKAPEWVRTPQNRDEVMQLWVKAEALRLTNMRASQAAKAGNPGPEGSVGKSMMATLNQAIFEKAVDLQGMEGQIDYDYTFRRPGEVDLTGSGAGVGYAFLRARANSIEGGTTEVMKNILGEQVLGLPGEPRVDKEIPWIDVPRG